MASTPTAVDILLQTVRLYRRVPSVVLQWERFRRQPPDHAHVLANTTAQRSTPAWYTFGTALLVQGQPPLIPSFFFVCKEKEDSVPSVPLGNVTDGNRGGTLGYFTASR